MIPKIKKRLSDFVKSEKGSVSKKALIDSAVTAGLVFVLSQSAAALSGTSHGNHITVAYSSGQDRVVGTHSNHSNHCNY